MEIFFRNYPWSEPDETLLVDALVRILHGPEFARFQTTPLNFMVVMKSAPVTDRRRKKHMQGHSGFGVITIGNLPAARQFLAWYADPLRDGRSVGSATRSIRIADRDLRLTPGRFTPPTSLVAELSTTPWVYPPRLSAQRTRAEALAAGEMTISEVQFGWICRDGSFSIERSFNNWQTLVFEDDKQRLVLHPEPWGYDNDDILQSIIHHEPLPPAFPYIVIGYKTINRCVAAPLRSSTPSILLDLSITPTFEKVPPVGIRYEGGKVPPRTRMPYPCTEMQRAGRYISRYIRLVTSSHAQLSRFVATYKLVTGSPPDSSEYESARHDLFSDSALSAFDTWIGGLAHPIAIQLEKLLYGHVLHTRELLSLRNDIEAIAAGAPRRAVSVLSAFGADLETAATQGDAQAWPRRLLHWHWDSALRNPTAPTPQATRGAPVATLHVALAPSSIRITGPIPEHSNRILRLYSGYQDNFIRVAFVDEDGRVLGYDPEVNVQQLITEHVVSVMTEGLMLGGRRYEYLGYSQSSVKQHSFWFVSAFVDRNRRTHNAKTIRATMGDFSADANFPARYAARISLAFSATLPSSRLLPDERVQVADIRGTGTACMTDGAGTMSVDSAEAFWADYCAARGLRRSLPCPSVIQIRVGGDKGVLIKDPTLGPGRRIEIRSSMHKFAPHAYMNEIEICRAFSWPSAAFLNRPLITVLEARGVPTDTFLQLQRNVVDNARLATRSFVSAAALLEKNGLGASFGLPSLFKSLSSRMESVADTVKLAPDQMPFIRQLLDNAIDHILRFLKFRGRIPISSSWNLVGVPDFQGVLKEGEVFICVRESPLSQPDFLQGEVLVSRSPVCHPGDVMVMIAIGRPPPDSAYSTETPENCIIFSTRGRRSPASCLGGGDYDGDEYLVSKLDSIFPRKSAVPFDYPPVKPKQSLNLEPAMVMYDIIQHAANLCLLDQLPRIASTWLRIADASEKGPFAEDCVKLSRLHSIACDYPKSGTPVDTNEIPRPPLLRPDWDSVELDSDEGTYRSDKALGHLYRAIRLADSPSVESAFRSTQARSPMRDSYRKESRIIELLRSGTHRSHPLRPRLEAWIQRAAPEALRAPVDAPEGRLSHALSLLNRFSTQLRQICQHNTLRGSKRKQLTEEEVCVGTIVERVSRALFRCREDHIVRMNEQTQILVDKIRQELCEDEGDEAGEEHSRSQTHIHRAWIAWQVATVHKGFGSGSFSLIALSVLLSALNSADSAAQSANAAESRDAATSTTQDPVTDP